jgi:flagellin-specific chaperone FliS
MSQQEAYIASRLSAIKAEQQQWNDALQYGQRALDIAKQHKLTHLEGEQLVLQALNAIETGDTEQAAALLKSAQAIFTQLENSQLQEQVQTYLDTLLTADTEDASS